MLDTGSPEAWVSRDCSNAVPAGFFRADFFSGDFLSEEYCESISRYKLGSSPTSKSLGSNNTLAYEGDGNQVDVDYYTDQAEVGGASVTGQRFGVATASNDIAMRIAGIGPNVFYQFENKSAIFKQSTEAEKVLEKIGYDKKRYPLLSETMEARGVILKDIQSRTWERSGQDRLHYVRRS